jgi:hypothetical protein
MRLVNVPGKENESIQKLLGKNWRSGALPGFAGQGA